MTQNRKDSFIIKIKNCENLLNYLRLYKLLQYDITIDFG